MSSLRDLETRLDGVQERLAPHVAQTPLKQLKSERLWLKCENRQKTGSFKLRGALNKLLVFREEARRCGVVAASAGNHGQGIGYAARIIGAPARVFVPQGALERKLDGMRRYGVEVIEVSGGYAEAESVAHAAALADGALWVSPYNDLEVIAGQATVGMELARDVDQGRQPLEVYVPVGGGGLISGVGAALRIAGTRMKLIGVQPEASPFLYAHHTGQSRADVAEGPTLADGLAGDVEDGSVTLELVTALVDEMRLVSEEEILRALQWCAAQTGEIIEPCAAAALACWRRDRSGAWAAVILSGGNVAPSLEQRVADR
jgi:threonine dehydratase